MKKSSLPFAFVVLSLPLFLAACGGGGSDTGAGPVTPEVPGTPSCLESESPPARLACFAGVHVPHNVWQGTPGWSQLVIGSDGSVNFAGKEVLSFSATDVVNVVDERATEGYVRVQVRRSASVTQDFRLWLHPDGKTLLDVEYEQDGGLQGVSLTAVPPWQDNHVGSLGHGVNAHFQGQKIPVYIDDDETEPSYADASTLHVSAIEHRGEAGEKGWRLHIGNFDPRDFPRDYPCVADSATVSVSLTLSGNTWSSATPGRCVINIAYIEYKDPRDRGSPIDYIDGHFVAELQGGVAGRPQRVFDGIFRIDVN